MNRQVGRFVYPTFGPVGVWPPTRHSTSLKYLLGGSFQLQMAFSWRINGGDPNYLLTGMILQVPPCPSLIGYIFFYLKIDDEMHDSHTESYRTKGWMVNLRAALLPKKQTTVMTYKIAGYVLHCHQMFCHESFPCIWVLSMWSQFDHLGTLGNWPSKRSQLNWSQVWPIGNQGENNRHDFP